LTLRTRLLLGLSAFVGALLLLGTWSAWHLWRMSTLSERIIAENYDSVVAAQEMKESLERLDSAGLFALLGRSDRAVPQIREHRARFDAAHRRAAANITERGEAAIVDTIGLRRDEYYQKLDQFMAAALRRTGAEATSQPAADHYFGQLEPLFTEIRRQCDRLLNLNQDAMRRKAREAAALARRWFLITLGMALALVTGGIVFAMLLSESITRPVRQLTQATDRVAAGDFDTTVNIQSGDELGTLAKRFNEMAERIRQHRRSDLGKVLIAQQTAEAAVDSLYDPIVVTDGDGRIRRINKAAETLFGPEATVLGRPVQDVTKDPRLSMAVLDVLQSQRAVASEEGAAIVPLVVDGAERAFRQRTTPMRDGDNRLLGAVTILEDITHLREIDRMKSEFINVASHELRTPLTSLEMGVHLLLEGAVGNLSPSQREVLEMCRDDTSRLDKLVKELLDLSRIESGDAAPHFTVVGPAEFVEGAVEPLRRQAEAKGLTLRVVVSEDLPQIAVDRGQVERVIANLVTNAIRATDRGGDIDVTATRRNGFVSISVRDTGRGIPHDYLTRVFEPFVQVPDVLGGGAGLGLSISRRIVQAHGGQISVRSELGRGTTFTFTVPVAAPAQAT
jgi:two-component system, NtrC family, sensor histidine kinase KinB